MTGALRTAAADRSIRRRALALVAGLALSASCAAAPAHVGAGTLPDFHATALTGAKVDARALLGRPTVLIVTPSRDAAEETRAWANALRKNLDPSKVRIRDVLAIDLPFFMSESDAIGRAKAKIPKRYHDQTWLLDEPVLEHALDIPTDSGSAFVLVLDARGEIVSRVQGAPDAGKLDSVESALHSLR